MAAPVSELQVVVSADVSELTRSLQTASQQVSSFGDSLKQGLGIGVGMAGVQAGIEGIGQAFGALKGSVIDFNQQLDQSRAVFTRYFEGNKQTAEAFLTTLKGFAARTPFEFKDLSTLAIRLQNANTSANDIIPTLKAIGNAASASGNLSQESIGRITTALTQMQMRGKVSAEEMMQLTEAGVPSWNLLAEATGKSVAQLQKMASQGEITADTFIAAFRGMYENAGLMEGASKSLEGALSTIRDVGTQAFADIGRSIYDLATEGANALAGLLSSEQFQTWVAAATIAVDAVVQGFRDLLTALAPVGEVLRTAFGQLSSGDFAGAFNTVAEAIRGVFARIREDALAFAHSLFPAGVALIDEYAAGMLEGSNRILVGALETISETIAAFFIGQSPPPEGPLKDIEKGGAATITAWGAGAASAADQAVKPAADKIADNLGELKLAGRDAEASIREIGQSIQDVERSSRDLKYTADDVKDAYSAQIGELDAQIKAIGQINDAERDREKLALNLEEIQLRQAEIAAMGNKELRAQIQTQLDALKSSSAERKNREAVLDAEKALAGSEKDRLKTKLEADKLNQQETDLRKRLKDAKPEERGRIQQQLKELEIRRQIDRAEASEREQAAQRRMADAQAKHQELTLQQQLNGLVDKEAIARIKSQQDVIKARKEEITLAEQAEKAARELAAAPLKAEKERLIAERDAMLAPLNEQLEALGRQKAVLSDQRQEYQNVKSEIAAATSLIKEQETAAKAAAKAAAEAAASLKTVKPDKSFTADLASQQAVDNAKTAGATLAGGVAAGFASLWDRLLPEQIRSGLDTIKARLATDGIPGLIQSIGIGLAAAVPAFAASLARWTEAFLAWAVETQRRVLDELSNLLEALLNWVETSAGPFGDTLYQWTLAWVAWAQEAWPRLNDQLAVLLGNALDWIGRTATTLAGALLDWATAFVAWVGPKIPELLSELGTLLATMIEWMGAHLGELLDALGRWAIEFVEWVAPKIPPLLIELGKLLVDLTAWIVTTALPAIAGKLAEWGAAIVEWVAPRIVPLLEALGGLLLKLTGWIITEALPAIVLKLAEWGAAFFGWVAQATADLLVELAKLGTAVIQWIIDQANPASPNNIPVTLGKQWGAAFLNWVKDDVLPTLPEKLGAILTAIGSWVTSSLDDVKKKLAEVGSAMLTGIAEGISNAWSTFTAWIQKNVVDALPKMLIDLMGLEHDTGPFARIGELMIDEIMLGIKNKLPALNRLVGSIGGGGGPMPSGDVGDWLRKAAGLTGTDDSWLPGLARLVSWESSGNPRIVNPEGVRLPNGRVEHAHGLLQMLPSTFASWKLPGMDDILNPIHNAAASIRYIKQTYGSVYDIPGIRSGNRSQFPGYAEGGIVRRPTLAMIGERGPEAVIPLSRATTAHQTITLNVAVGGRVAEQIVVEGYELAIRRGRLLGAATLPARGA